MFTKNKTCLEAGKKLEDEGMLADLKAQPLVRLQHKYYGLFFLTATYIYPVLVTSLWGETLWNALFVAGAVPLLMSFQSTMCVNSLAHMWGERFVVCNHVVSPRSSSQTVQ
jgi:stearoyl-CoA desaturase (delta-9 desaturase)